MPSADDNGAAARVGSVLNDKWTLEKLIGVGGMGAVYAGVHRNGARAAIKLLHPVFARLPEVKRRFLREGYAANRVGHSGVVKVLDDDEILSGPDAGGAFLVMELLEGTSVEDRIEHGPAISERELLAIVRAVLTVLEAAHAAGVIHRDLKPENLFLARDPEQLEAPPRIKILDFGLARVAEGGSKTMAGTAIGTPSYMPPEQATGRVQEIDARSDLFALGATCFRILAGRTVHPADTPLKICALMATRPAPRLRSVAPNVSEKTARVVDRALALRREDRWPDAAAMREAVDEAIEGLGGDTIPIESGMIEAVEDPQPHHAEETPRRSRAGRWFVVLLGVGVAAAAGKVAWDRGLLGPDPPVSAVPEAAPTSAEPDAAPTSVPEVAPEGGEPEAASTGTEPVQDALQAEDAGRDVEADAQLDAMGAPDAQAPAGHHHPDGGVRHPLHNPRRHRGRTVTPRRRRGYSAASEPSSST